MTAMVADRSAHSDRLGQALKFCALVAAVIVICFYTTYGLGRSLWLDEANSVHIAQGTPNHVLDALSRDVSPPLYYWFLSGWMRLFGKSEIALRVPSILFYLCGIATVYFLGRMLLGEKGGVLASFIYAIHPIMGRQAQNVRMFTMLSLAVAVSTMVFVILARDAKHRTPGWFALFGLTTLVGMNVHYWFGFVLVAYFCWVFLTWRSWNLKELILFTTFATVPFIALDLRMFVHQAQLPSTAWTPRPTLLTLIHAVVVVYQFDAVFLLITLAITIAVFWAISCGALRVFWARRRQWMLPCFLYGLSMAVPFLISLKRPIFWAGRYDIIAIPFLAVWVAAFLLCIPQNRRSVLQLILAASACFYFVRAVHQSQTKMWLDMLDPVPLGDRSAASAICSEAQPGDFVIYTGLSRAAVSFYLQRFGCSTGLKQVSYPAEFEHHLGWQDPNRAYSEEPSIRSEGVSVVERVSAARSRIFLLFNSDARLSRGIVSPIEQHFHMQSSRGFESCGPCFQKLRVYAPKTGWP
jgi:hypothetical protein